MMNLRSFDDDEGPGSFAHANNATNRANNNNNMNQYGGNYCNNNQSTQPFRGSQIQQQVLGSQERTLEHQRRALQSIYQSEQIGTATAQELSEQGEILRGAEAKLDNIAEVQKHTQRQINSLSSVFGGVKNWFAKKPSTTISENPPAKPSFVDSMRNSISGITGGPTSDQPGGVNASRSINAQLYNVDAQIQQQKLNSQPQQQPTSYQKQLDSNLDEMSVGVGRLKNLSKTLNSELVKQNEDLERMGGKMENTQKTMSKQEKQLQVLLHGNKKK